MCVSACVYACMCVCVCVCVCASVCGCVDVCFLEHYRTDHLLLSCVPVKMLALNILARQGFDLRSSFVCVCVAYVCLSRQIMFRRLVEVTSGYSCRHA